MFRPVARSALTAGIGRSATRSQRFLSTAPPHEKSRSWKNSAARWTVAGAVVYYYNTHNVFAEDQNPITVHAPPQTQTQPSSFPTLDAVVAQREAQAKIREAREAVSSNVPETTVVDAQVPAADAAAPGSPDELEEEASQQGAFNEETGEINWDCPCLGGMAHGPCGEEFREAFSCFVYSKEEPKGVDCIDKFKNMQNCFRAHPDIYGAELDDNDEVPEGESGTGEAAAQPETPVASSSGGEKVAEQGIGKSDDAAKVAGKRARAQEASKQVKAEHGEPSSETDEVVPKAWHDAN